MRRGSVTLLLLAILLGMSAGPHPCHAAEKAPVAPAMTEHASCHGAQAPLKAPQPRSHDCCDPVKGGHVLCDQACQGAAVIGIAPALPEILSFQELAAPVPHRSCALLVLAIDHVPLA